MAEVLASLEQGLGELIRKVGEDFYRVGSGSSSWMPMGWRGLAHKIRNILAYLPDTHHHWFKYKLRLAYAHADATDARQTPVSIAR